MSSITRVQTPMRIPGIDVKVIPSLVVLTGLTFSFLAAIVPYHGSAYRLLPVAMAAGFTTYAVYGVLAATWASSIVRNAGLGVLGTHVLAVVLLRTFVGGDLRDALLAVLPAALALGLLALSPRALRASTLTARDSD
jgi:hypothetical protein